MKQITATVTCDNCGGTVTVGGTSHADITRQLTAAGWPQLRGRRDLCPTCHRPSRQPTTAEGDHHD